MGDACDRQTADEVMRSSALTDAECASLYDSMLLDSDEKKRKAAKPAQVRAIVDADLTTAADLAERYFEWPSDGQGAYLLQEGARRLIALKSFLRTGAEREGL